MMKCIIASIVIVFISFSLDAQRIPKTGDNDFGMCVIPGDFADPSVILVNGTYYAAGTSSEWAPHFPLFKSTDLVHWDPIGFVFKVKPSWTSSSFWAPELFYHQGKFFVYYVARRASDGVSCIGVATSDDPSKGFEDHGIIVETGKEAIDPFVFKDQDQLYMSWKAYGLDDRPIELLCATLSKDGMHITGPPFTLLKDENRKGLEGQCLIKDGDYYYLFYSKGNCCGSACTYSVSVARASSIHGSFEPYHDNPIVKDDDSWKCPGHGTLVKSKENQWYYLYHAYSKSDHVFTGRQGMLTTMSFQNGWPVGMKPKRAAPVFARAIEDNFDAALSTRWQWDFRHSNQKVDVSSGKLCLTGIVDTATNKTGNAITLRPYSGTYEMTVQVINDVNHKSFKGLTVYGDAGQSLGIGTNGTLIQVWQVKDNKKTIVKQESLAATRETVALKISADNGHRFKFFWRKNGEWNEVTTDASFLDGNFLPPWDRSPRPGLYHLGGDKDEACFDEFRFYQLN